MLKSKKEQTKKTHEEEEEIKNNNDRRGDVLTLVVRCNYFTFESNNGIYEK